MERTLVILKPDAIQRNLAGKLLTRFDEKGFRMVECMVISQDLAKKHYA